MHVVGVQKLMGERERESERKGERERERERKREEGIEYHSTFPPLVKHIFLSLLSLFYLPNIFSLSLTHTEPYTIVLQCMHQHIIYIYAYTDFCVEQ